MNISRCLLPILVHGRPVRLRRRAGSWHAQSQAVAAAGQSKRSRDTGQGIVRPQAGSGQHAGARDRILYAAAVLPAALLCRSTARTGRSCGCRAIAIGAIPNLIDFLERLAAKAPKVGWNGLLVGDMAQARGGPMLTGHASHQVGLDADIWLTPMPNRELTPPRTRRNIGYHGRASGPARCRPESLDAGPSRHPARCRAGSTVERVLVNAAIKKALVP